MDIHTNKRNVRRVHEEGFGNGDLAVVDECVAPDAVDHQLLAEGDLPAALKGIIGALRAAMPDLRHTVEDVIAEGDRVAARVVVTGTHTGAPLFGIPASGRRVHAEQFHIVRCDDRGRAVEHWAAVGADEMVRQLTGVADASVPS
jgi:predicted ester cyclase